MFVPNLVDFQDSAPVKCDLPSDGSRSAAQEAEDGEEDLDAILKAAYKEKATAKTSLDSMASSEGEFAKMTTKKLHKTETISSQADQPTVTLTSMDEPGEDASGAPGESSGAAASARRKLGAEDSLPLRQGTPDEDHPAAARGSSSPALHMLRRRGVS